MTDKREDGEEITVAGIRAAQQAASETLKKAREEEKKYFKQIFACGIEKLPKEKKEELWNYFRYLITMDQKKENGKC